MVEKNMKGMSYLLCFYVLSQMTFTFKMSIRPLFYIYSVGPRNNEL